MQKNSKRLAQENQQSVYTEMTLYNDKLAPPGHQRKKSRKKSQSATKPKMPHLIPHRVSCAGCWVLDACVLGETKRLTTILNWDIATE